MGKKVEIIEINIDIDIDEEIKKKVESLKTDISVHTRDLVNRAKLRKVKTNRKAGAVDLNRCETVGKTQTKNPPKKLTVKTNVKAGAIKLNRCETVAKVG